MNNLVQGCIFKSVLKDELIWTKCLDIWGKNTSAENGRFDLMWCTCIAMCHVVLIMRDGHQSGADCWSSREHTRASEMRKKIDKSFLSHFSICLFWLGFLNSVWPQSQWNGSICVKYPCIQPVEYQNLCVFAVILIEVDYIRSTPVCIVVFCESTCFTTRFTPLWVLFSSCPLMNPCSTISVFRQLYERFFQKFVVVHSHWIMKSTKK